MKKIKYIGDTMDPEISLPRWPRFNVYADTETYLRILPDLKPWEYPGTPEYTQTMQCSDNIPWLLVWSFKSLKRKFNGETFVGGGWVMRSSLLWEDLHEELFIHLGSIYKLKRLPVLLFHNASFDLTAIMRIWKILDPDIVVYYYAKSTNKSFLRGVMYSPKYKFKCQLEDTMLYETISIETIGFLLGKHKGKDVPYSMSNMSIVDGVIHYTDYTDGIEKTFPLDKYIEYAKRDVEIQREYGESLIDKKQLIAEVVIEDPISFSKLWKNIKGSTQGSFTKELVDIYLKQNGFRFGIDGHFRYDIPEEEDDLYQQTVMSNMGGYTTFNRDIRRYDCAEDEAIYVFDCNSEYPYILTKDIPYDKLLDTPPEDSKYITWYVVSFKKCKWKEGMDSLMWCLVSTEKVCPDLELKFYMLKEYYDLINRLCEHESTIHEIKYQRTTKIFSPFINRLYGLRKTYKLNMTDLNKNTREYDVLDKQQQGCKVIMNSLYGKLCEKSHREGCFYYSKHTKYKKFVNKVAPLKCILSGSFITYSGRLLLLSKIETCIKQGFKVLYADTDSVMFVCKKNDPMIYEIFGLDTGELGQWKCEGVFNLFLNSGVKKKYCLLDTNNPSNYKIAWSGINKAVPKAFQKSLSEGNKQTIDDLAYIFNPRNNVVFRKQKRQKVLNNTDNQKIIYDTDFQMNKGLGKVTGECHIVNGEYVLEKYGQ